MGPAQHPIRGEVVDVNGAMANFDAITYVKGQSVLHQLMAYIGEDAFVEGLRAYFRDHAFGNTVLDDLMTAYADAAGRDLSEWTAAWLDRSGTDVLALDGSTVRAESPDDEAPRPHRINIASYSVDGRDVAPGGGGLDRADRYRRPRSSFPAGDLRLLNADDFTFAAVRPDAASLELMLDHLGDFPEPLSRALVVGTITQLLLLGELAPRDRVPSRSVAPSTPSATRRSSSRSSPSAITSPTAGRGRPSPRHCARRSPMPRQCSPATRPTASRRCARWPRTPPPTSTGQCWRRQPAPRPTPTWRGGWPIRNAELGKRDDDAVARLLERDADPDAGVKRLKVLAASPDEEAKETVWRAFFVDYSVPASRDTLELGAIFWRPEQSELLAAYTHRYLKELPSLKGGMLNQGVVIRAMYPHAVGDASFLAAAVEAGEDESISLYARNQLRSQSFVLGRLHQAQEL